MLFSTMQKRNEVIDTIERRGEFLELNECHNAQIRACYLILDAIENAQADYSIEDAETTTEKMVAEIGDEAIQHAYNHAVLQIAELVVVFEEDEIDLEEVEC